MSTRTWHNVQTMDDVRRFAGQHSWTLPKAYAVSWTAAGGGTPYVGDDGALEAYYIRNDFWCAVTLNMTYGSTGTPSPGSSGEWRFSLPLDCIIDRWHGAGEYRDFGTNIFGCTTVIEGNLLKAQANGDATRIGVGTPITWANNDYLRLSIMYPIRGR